VYIARAFVVNLVRAAGLRRPSCIGARPRRPVRLFGAAKGAVRFSPKVSSQSEMISHTANPLALMRCARKGQCCEPRPKAISSARTGTKRQR